MVNTTGTGQTLTTPEHDDKKPLRSDHQSRIGEQGDMKHHQKQQATGLKQIKYHS